MSTRSTLLKRIAQQGFTGFYRNRTVSLSSIFILTITLSIITSFYLFQAVFAYTLDQVKERVDVRIYFTVDATEEQVNDIKAKLIGLPQVKEVVYISREQALSNFRDRHNGDQLTLQALDELGSNPFGASLSIQAKDPSQYEAIANSLSTGGRLLGETSNVVDKINYYQ